MKPVLPAIDLIKHSHCHAIGILRTMEVCAREGITQYQQSKQILTVYLLLLIKKKKIPFDFCRFIVANDSHGVHVYDYVYRRQILETMLTFYNVAIIVTSLKT